MHKIVIVCIFFTIVSQATSDSICQELFQAGSQRELMKHFVELSFTMLSVTDSIAPYFDGRALDRNGNHVTDYFSDDTMRKSLIESHVQYYGQMFNCSDESFANGYHGPSMAEAHAHLFIGRSLFAQYQQLSLQYLSIALFNPLTLRQLMNTSKVFEEHRRPNTTEQICNEADCQEAVLSIDEHENITPYYINMEQGQDITISNQFFAKGYDFAVSGSKLCQAVSPIVHVDISSNLTTSILAALPGGDYYLGTWPRATCTVDTRSRGKILAQIHIPSRNDETPIDSPANAPIEAPTEPTPIITPTDAPIDTPINVSVPTTPSATEKEPTDLMPVVIVLSIVLGILIIVAVVLGYKLKRKQPQYYDTIQ